MIKISSIKLIAYGVLLAMTLSCCREASLPVEAPVPVPVETQLPNPCASEDISEFVLAIDDIEKRFEDLTLRAEDTSPENLKPIIEEMQAIEQEFKNSDVPPCALRVKAAFENYFFSKVQCYFHVYAVEGLGNTPPPGFEAKIDFCVLALEQLEYYQTQRDALGNQ